MNRKQRISLSGNTMPMLPPWFFHLNRRFYSEFPCGAQGTCKPFENKRKDHAYIVSVKQTDSLGVNNPWSVSAADKNQTQPMKACDSRESER